MEESFAELGCLRQVVKYKDNIYIYIYIYEFGATFKQAPKFDTLEQVIAYQFGATFAQALQFTIIVQTICVRGECAP